MFLTRVLRVLFFRKWGPELNFKRERERERGVLSIGEGFERVPLGRSAVEKAEKLAEPGQADTAGSRLRRNLIGYVCRRKSSGSLYIYVCIYTYAHLSPERGGRRGKRLVPLFSIVFLAKSRLEISTFPPFPRRSRIKLPGTRTGINFAAERARVEIRAPLLNHSRKLRSERFRTKRGRFDYRREGGGAIIPPWTWPVSVFIKLETLCPQAGIAGSVPEVHARYCESANKSNQQRSGQQRSVLAESGPVKNRAVNRDETSNREEGETKMLFACVVRLGTGSNDRWG